MVLCSRNSSAKDASPVSANPRAALSTVRGSEQRVRDALEDAQRAIDRINLAARRDIQPDRRRADDQEDRKATAENETLGSHRRLVRAIISKDERKEPDSARHSLTAAISACGVNGCAQAGGRAELDRHPVKLSNTVTE